MGALNLQKGAVEVRRHVADQLRRRWPQLATPMDESEADVAGLHGLSGPAPHQVAQHEPFERLNKEVKRRADGLGIFPNEDSISRLIGAARFERNDDWQSRN